jgi:hypothetical protein
MTLVLKELAASMLKALQEQELMPIMWDHSTMLVPSVKQF